MKLAAMNYHYCRYPFSYFLDKVVQTPFKAIELHMAAPHINPYTYTLRELLDMQKQISGRGLETVAITPENVAYPVNFSSHEKSLRDESLRYYMKVVDAAQFLDAPRVQLCLGGGYFNRPREEAWEQGKDSLAQLAQYAEKKGITLILEELMVTTSNVINTSAELARMIDEVGAPNVVGMLDLSQMSWMNETPDDYFRNLGGRLQHIHFNDRGHLVPGDGDLPMKQHYNSIVANGYDGTMSFEICDRRYFCDPNAALDATIAWFRENTDELG